MLQSSINGQPSIRITLFGGLSVQAGNQPPVELPPQQSAALLAYFALNNEQALTREAILELFWPDSEPDKARQNLRQCLHTLRDLLKPHSDSTVSALIATRTSIQLDPQVVSTDVAEFERVLKAATASQDIEERIRLRSVAAALYRGELLPGFYADCFVLEQHHLAERHRQAVGLLIADLESSGDPSQALQYAHNAVILDPLSEEASTALMRIYAAMGQPAAVQRQFVELESRLEKDGEEGPSDEIRQLSRRLQESARRRAASLSPSTNSVKTIDFDWDDSWRPGPAHYVAAENNSGSLAKSLPARSTSRVGWKLAAAAIGLTLLYLLVGIGRRHAATGAPPVDDVRMNGSSSEAWAVRYHPHSGESITGGSQPTAIAVDKEGDIYIAGLVSTLKTDVDYLTLKYSPQGKLLWQQRYNGPGNDFDKANSIAIDGAGCVYVTGESDGAKGHGPERLSGCDIATIKYEPDGKRSPSWPDVGFGLGVRRFAGPADGMDSGRKIMLDAAGNVVVFGQSWGGDPKDGGTAADLVVIKYDSSGHETRSARYVGGTVGSGAAADMVLDAGGNAYVIGKVLGPKSLPTLITLKYDDKLNLKWEDRYIGKEEMGAAPTCMVQNCFEEIYVVGHETFAVSHGQGPGEAYAILKFNQAGKRLWRQATTYRWPGYSYLHLPAAATLDASNDLYVTGTILGESSSPGCGTLNIAADGAICWADPYRSTGHHGHFGSSMAITSLGEVVAAGWGTFLDPTAPAKDSSEFAVLEFERDTSYAQGPTQPEVRRLGAFDRITGTVLTAVDRADNIIVCGQAVIGSRGEIATFKYHP